MTLILWTGKNGELLFNRRRCSQDSAVIADISTMFNPADICVSAYSSPLFPGAKVIQNLQEAENSVLFLENLPLSPALMQTTHLVVYRFDRVYPADVRLEIPKEFQLKESKEFSGSSHDKITREVYEK